MRSRTWDAIVVGARAAGAATAMLLARRGMNVLVLERARYGSDTLSTHALMRTAVLQLRRWGLLDAVRQTATPPIRRVVFRYPDETVPVELRPADGIDALYAPRRTVLDPILADAAAAAGATLSFGVMVDGLLKDATGRVTGIAGRDEEGREISASAPIVIGADGIRSVVARQARAVTLREARAEGAVLYGYFRDVAAEGYEWAYGDRVSAGMIPTTGGEVCVFAGSSTARYRAEIQPDLERGFHRIVEEASPDIAGRLRRGGLTSRLRGFAGVRGHVRQPFGPGWALVGDAGYFRDPITTHGISDAFRDAEMLARALAGPSSLEEYAHLRDRMSAPLFEVTERIASYDWEPDEIRTHLRDVSRAMKPEMEWLLSLDRAAAA